MTEPHTSDGALVPDDEDTQEIPVIDGDDYGAVPTAARRQSSTYEVLPSDAFAPSAVQKRRRVAMIAVGVAAVAAIIIGGIWIAADGDDGSSAPTASDGVVEPPGPTPPPVDTLCPATVSGNTTTGRDAGGQDSGVGVIKAFNYAYYNKRDAQAVSEFVLPAARSSVIPSIPNLQKAIDALPKPTTHCLTITDLGGGLHRVALTQFDPSPGGNRVTFNQMIQTTNENGKWLIVSNTAVD